MGDTLVTKRGKEVIQSLNKTSIPERVYLLTLEGTLVANDIFISSYEGEHKPMHLLAAPGLT